MLRLPKISCSSTVDKRYQIIYACKNIEPENSVCTYFSRVNVHFLRDILHTIYIINCKRCGNIKDVHIAEISKKEKG